MENRQEATENVTRNGSKDWLLRFIKGMFIGSGFILPGVSGGALAAVFGMYERLISFLAHITKNFKENVWFFLPVGLGGVTGVFLLSFLVSFLLGAYETTILWFFVGCIAGTVPTLWKEAGKKGTANDGCRDHGRYFCSCLSFSTLWGTTFRWSSGAKYGYLDHRRRTDRSWNDRSWT